MKKYYNEICFFMMGLIVFSSLGSTIMIDYFHFPMSLPEVLFLPFLILLRKKMRSIKVDVSEVIGVVLFCIFLVLIGLLYGQYSLFSMLSSARAWIYLLICFFLFKRKNSITNSDLSWLCFGSICAWFIDSQLNFKSLMAGMINGHFVTTYGLMLAVPYFFSSTLYRKKYILFIVSIFIISGTILYAGIRRLLAVTVVTLIFAVFLSLKKSGKRVLPYIIVCSLLVSGFIIAMPTVENYMKEQSYGMYYRIFIKTEAMTDNTTDIDTKRQRHFSDLAEDFIDYTVPRGMVSMKTSQDKEAGKFNDFPLYQLCWIFSWPVTLIILSYFIVVFLRNFEKYNRIKDETSIISVNCILIMFFLLFLEGTFIEYPYATPITGVILGRALLNSKTKRVIL